MARTKLYMDEHGYSYEGMTQRKAELAVQEKALSEKISAAQSRIAEINVLKTHIVNYSKTKEVYVAYRKSGSQKSFWPSMRRTSSSTRQQRRLSTNWA